MEHVWFKINDGEEAAPVWTTTDGKVDFKNLGHRFHVKSETITLDGGSFSRDSTGKSDLTWMQIRNAFGVAGTEVDPVPVETSLLNKNNIGRCYNQLARG